MFFYLIYIDNIKNNNLLKKLIFFMQYIYVCVIHFSLVEISVDILIKLQNVQCHQADSQISSENRTAEMYDF